MRGRLLLLACLVASGCGGGGDKVTGTGVTPVTPDTSTAASADTFGLRVLAAAHGLRFGAEVDAGLSYTGTEGTTFRTILAHEFSITVPGNSMKFDHIHPSQNTFNFAAADSLVAFAAANAMQVRGHTLVWYNQLPSWVTSGTWTAAQATSIMQAHIAAVVGHYKGQLVSWDVVNEALNDNGTLRPGFWNDHIGPSYIETAFRAAHDADSSVALFYNDYNLEGSGAKQDSAYAMITALLAKGVPINGVGLQGHFIVGGVPSTIAASIARFAGLGLKVHITELDDRIQLPSSSTTLAQQAADYRSVVQACMSVSGCTAIVTWGLSDKDSWIPGAFPGFGEALLYDASYAKKPAYAALYSLWK
jgi:endo-1,4-beta-xylanase